MVYERNMNGHSYVFDVDYGEEAEVARVIVRSDAAGREGLFLVDREGAIEAAEDLPGFGPNPLAADGLWPRPPQEAIADARLIVEHKAADD